MRRIYPLLLLTGLSVGAVGCPPKQVPATELYRSGARETALSAQREAAAVIDADQPLDQLRLASMAYALGDAKESEAALRRAVGPMTNFRADGEFAALLAAESRKDWKGEPFEKMAAFTMLGTLLWQQGDRGNALAMFKSAVLADTGSADERFRSDFVPGWVLQALVYQAEGEDENARVTMARGIDALWSRHTVEDLTYALRRVDIRGEEARVRAAKAAILAGLSSGVSASPRDAPGAVRATLGVLPDLLRLQQEKPKKERLSSLARFTRADFALAFDGLGMVGEVWAKGVDEVQSDAVSQGEAFATSMTSLLETPPNLVLLVERGTGPRKIRTGEYGELLSILPGRHREIRPDVRLDGAYVAPVFLESLSYQATTRGGRKVDSFLHGKAVYKDASLISGYVALRIAEIAHYADNDQLAVAAAIVGGILTVTSLVSNPAADIRQWEQTPDAWYLVAVHVPPGQHSLEIDRRTYAVTVPEHGQTVRLVPRLFPGGVGAF
jgi:hypothetical protein